MRLFCYSQSMLPVARTANFYYIYVFAGVAQLVEQLIRNQQVRGSNPLASSQKKGLIESLFLFCHCATFSVD